MQLDFVDEGRGAVAAPGWRTSLGDPAAILSHILAATPDAIFAKDLRGRYVLVNQALLDVFGRRAEDALGERMTSSFRRHAPQCCGTRMRR